MSEPRHSSSQCPACTSGEIEFWKELDSNICSECGYVLQASDAESELGEPIEINGSQESRDSQDEIPWKEHISIKDKSEANLVDVLEMTESISESLSLSDDTISRAGEVVTQAWESNFMHGRTKELVVGAALYLASRETGRAVPPGAIAEEVQSEKSSIKSVYRDLKRDQQRNIDPPSPEEYVEYLCSTLEFTESVAEVTTTLLTERDTGRGGNPIGIAAGGIYQATVIEEKETTLREIADAAGLTKETVWRHANRFRADSE